MRFVVRVGLRVGERPLNLMGLPLSELELFAMEALAIQDSESAAMEGLRGGRR